MMAVDNETCGRRVTSEMLHVALAFTFSVMFSMEASAGYSYDADNRALMVTVDSGSESFDVANYGSYVTDNVVTNVTKAGGGELELGSVDFSAYTGRFTISTGIVSFASASALGAASANISVKNGGTLMCRVNAADFRLDNSGTKIVEFEGTGVNNMGALAFGSRTQTTGAFGKKYVMTGDATISGEVSYGFIYGTTLDMGGHELKCKTVLSRYVQFSGMTLSNPGRITVDGPGGTTVANGIKWNGSADNVLSTSSGTFTISSFPQNTATAQVELPWTLNLNCASGYDINFGYNTTNYKLNPAYNCWQGPIRVGQKQIKVIMTNPSTGGSFAGKVSGGGFYLEGNVTGEKPNREDSHLHLCNPENDFTGGVKVARANLHLWADGALPAAGSNLQLIDSSVYLDATNSSYTLPGLVVEGTGTVYNGRGRWSGGIVKKGSGDLCLQSLAGAPSVDVQGGSVTLKPHSKSLLAGLIGGAYYKDYTAVRIDSYCPTNSVSLSPEAMYNKTHAYWTNTYGPENDPNKRAVVYHGYLWNNGPTANWTFAGNIVMHYGLYIDGREIIYQSAGNGSVWRKETVEMTTGPHEIQIRVYATTGGGPKGPTNITASVDFGFPRYDPLGRGSENSNDYIKLEDPGDGSLLTWDLPGKIEYTHPVTGDAVVTVPVFESMTFTNGTSLVCSSNEYAVADIVGLPSITECPLFTVTNSWTLSAADANGGGVLSTDGVLAFGEGTTLDVTGKVSHENAIAVATAAGGITGMPSLDAKARWTVFKSGDGKTLYIRRRVAGLVVGFR